MPSTLPTTAVPLAGHPGPSPLHRPHTYAPTRPRAATEARERHARLDVVRVVPRAVGFARVPAAWLRLRGEVARLLPRTQHVSTRLRIVRGDAAEQLTRLAARADVLVVGARMNSRHGAPLGGQTVPAILSGASCPVIICDDGAEPDTRTGGHAEDDTRLR